VIGFLSGRLAGRSGSGCLLDVAGVGYRLTCSTSTLAALPADGAPCRLWTHLAVRDDSLTLFGFATEAEQGQFEALLGVAGIGPKVALAVCSGFAPDAFRRALASDDAAALASVPGLGRRTAQRLLVDLKDRFDLPVTTGAEGARAVLAQARSALENLGYSPAEVRAALDSVPAGDDAAVEDVVRNALKVLAA
jgi:Holliday junction DNA helicase RuvA